MNRLDQPLQRFYRVFSGESSKRLWKRINKIKDGRTNYAVSELAYHCQDLESQIRALESRLAKLEDR